MPDRHLPGDHTILDRLCSTTYPDFMARTLTAAAAVTMQEVRSPKMHNWPCKKCGEKFHPNEHE